MLTAAFPKLANTQAVQALRKFVRSPWYCALIAELMALSEIFSAELPVYYLYFTIGVICLLLCEDSLGIIPIVCCGYMTFSAPNNPGKFPETSAFRQPEALFQLAVILAVAVILFLGRFLLSLWELPKKQVPKLAVGFAVLGAAYLLAGAFSGFYAFDTVLFGFVQIVSLSFFYFFFYYTVDWRTVKPGYFASVFLAVGLGMVAEVIGMYFLPGVIVDGVLHRGALYTGWGVYNNVGCIMAMCLPAPFYFAAKKKCGWFYAVLGCIFFLAVVLTQSRGSVLSAAVVFALCGIVALVKAKKREKIGVGVVLGAFVLTMVILLLIKQNELKILFASLFGSGMDDSGRFDIYRECWNDFVSSPFFGKGFYHSSGYVAGSPGAFIPKRAHDTLFQLLASGGMVALIAYLFHRFQTVWLYFRHPTTEKTFSFFCIAALLLTSLLDCNFFNIGPGLLYSVLLVCAECTDPKGRLYKTKKAKQIAVNEPPA